MELPFGEKRKVQEWLFSEDRKIRSSVLDMFTRHLSEVR